MIDDKKIEEAAKHYAEENSMSIEDQMGDTYNGIEELSDAYKAGAKWAINEFLRDLLHPASEEPKKGRVFLYKTILNGYGVNQIIDGSEWKYIIKYQKATQWLYIEDLFPKEGGEQ